MLSYETEVTFVRALTRNGFGILGQHEFFDQVTVVTFKAKSHVFDMTA